MRNKCWSSVTKYIDVFSKWIGYIGIVGIIVTKVSQLLKWQDKWLFGWLKDNIQWVYLGTLTAFLFTLWIWVSRLHKRFVRGFRDNFTGELRENWDFTGEWRIVEKGTLLVDKSPRGGLTKVGAYWENYTLKFKAFIMNQCLGVIVRAQDLNNYYMFQIRKNKIRPHRRVTVPVIEKMTHNNNSEGINEDFVIKYEYGWQLFKDYNVNIDPSLNNWFDVEITVRGESVFIYIDNELIFQNESFLKIPCGKIGFRNFGSESAKVKRVHVILRA